MQIKRMAEQQIEEAFNSKKIAVIYGARQVGKTTLAKSFSEKYQKTLYLTTDDLTTREILTNATFSTLKSLIGDSELLIIDEAQRVENIGLTLKLIHDSIPELKIIATGSSSFDLSNKINEPLTGRKRTILLYPFSLNEVSADNINKIENSEKMLIRGGYPEIWTKPLLNATKDLQELAESYVFKDTFAPNVIYDQTILLNLMRLLAFQIGNDVSYNELSKSLNIAKDTVMRYVDLLEKAFIIFRLNQYRKNQRVEVGRLRKIYFYDLGIRNALVNNFSQIEVRGDVGAIWENFCVAEILKNNSYDENHHSLFYWRDNKKHEIDIIQEKDGEISALECKYSPQAKFKIPSEFIRQYPECKQIGVINKQNFIEFL